MLREDHDLLTIDKLIADYLSTISYSVDEATDFSELQAMLIEPAFYLHCEANSNDRICVAGRDNIIWTLQHVRDSGLAVASKTCETSRSTQVHGKIARRISTYETRNVSSENEQSWDAGVIHFQLVKMDGTWMIEATISCTDPARVAQVLGREVALSH